MFDYYKYQDIKDPVCSRCGGLCYYHGLEGHWIFACYCAGAKMGSYPGIDYSKPAIPVARGECVKDDKDWSREDD